MVKVWLDDNTWVMTAPEHPFILRDGSTLRADELKPEMSLMPFYRKKSIKGGTTRLNGYEMVFSPSTGL
jgi:DNA gyrase subunit B